MTDATGHRLLLQRLLAAINAHDTNRVAALYRPDYEGLDVSRAIQQHGPEDARADWAVWLRAFPDLHVTIEETVRQKEQVALYWTKEGTHQGPFLHVPPTGHRVRFKGVSLLTIKGGRIVRALHLWDLAGLLRAMRLLPDLPDTQPLPRRFSLHVGPA